MRKVALFKVQKGAAHLQGGAASASDAVVEEEGAREGAAGGSHGDLMTPKPEKATHGIVIVNCSAAEDQLQHASQ
jgi:hypothetical protein